MNMPINWNADALEPMRAPDPHLDAMYRDYHARRADADETAQPRNEDPAINRISFVMIGIALACFAAPFIYHHLTR